MPGPRFSFLPLFFNSVCKNVINYEKISKYNKQFK
jgi:hypothetical protein